MGRRRPRSLNLGLSSETCTGLSEPDHPFLRPNVHNRLERVLSMARPDAVVACYGMNDGIYSPPDPERFAAYQEGIRSLVGRARASGAVVVLLTPQAFDPLPLAPRGKLLPAEAPKFSYLEVYENYDSVIGRYGEWVLSQTEGVERTIDIQGPLRDRLAEARRSDPGFSMAPDGVHYDRRGHRIMARAILESWGIAPTREGEDAELEDLCIQRARLLHAAWLSHVGHRRPLVRKGMPLGAALRRRRAAGAPDRGAGRAVVDQTADSPRSPVRMRSASSTGRMKIFPSPIFPVLADLDMASMAGST